MKMVLKQGMFLAVVGIFLSIAGAFVLTRLLSSLLFNVSASAPTIYASVAALLSLVAFLACYVPARRATKVDPMVALRYE